MIVVNDENYELELFSRVPNSPYEWNSDVKLTFKGRPANQIEKKQYRILAGVNGGTDSTYIISSNLPEDIKVKDKIKFMGKIWTVNSVGYYFDQSQIVNPRIMSEKYIAERSPKGINIG